MIWRSRAPMTRKVFGWLAARDRYWMANVLEQCGLPHPTDCPFCDQQLENLQPILLGCVLAKEVWSVILGDWGKLEWIPTVDNNLVDWWARKEVPGWFTSGIQMTIFLVLWSLWRHRNNVMFNGVTPMEMDVLHRFKVKGLTGGRHYLSMQRAS